MPAMQRVWAGTRVTSLPDKYLPAIGQQAAGNQVKKRGFARAIGADDAQGIALLHLQNQ